MMLMTLMNFSLLSILLLLPVTLASPLGPSDFPQYPLAPIASSLTNNAPSSSPSSSPPSSSSSSSSSSTNSTAASLFPRDPSPDPQSTCQPNSGTGNSGCNNSGVSNSGTDNSGICLSGTGQSGVGACSSGAPVAVAVATSTYILASPTTVYVVQTVTLAGDSVVTTVQSVIAAGATATQTVVVDAGKYNRPGCAYWRTQGYTCSDAGRVWSVERWLFWPIVVGVMGAVLGL